MRTIRLTILISQGEAGTRIGQQTFSYRPKLRLVISEGRGPWCGRI